MPVVGAVSEEDAVVVEDSGEGKPPRCILIRSLYRECAFLACSMERDTTGRHAPIIVSWHVLYYGSGIEHKEYHPIC